MRPIGKVGASIGYRSSELIAPAGRRTGRVPDWPPGSRRGRACLRRLLRSPYWNASSNASNGSLLTDTSLEIGKGVLGLGGLAGKVPPPARRAERAEGAAGWITRRFQCLGDEPKERLAGPLDFLGGLQIGHGVRRGVEPLEGDARL